jgi:hypothetical protein
LNYPELAVNSTIPEHDEVVPDHIFQQFTFTTNATGKFIGILQPQAFYDTANTASANIIFNNDATLNFSTATVGKFAAGVNLTTGIPGGIVDSFQVVSCALHVVPTSPILNLGGKVFTGLFRRSVPNTAWVVATGIGAVTTYDDLTVMNRLTNIPMHNITHVNNLQSGQTSRMLWFPENPKDFDYIPTDNCKAVMEGGSEPTGFIIFGVDLNTTAAVSFDVKVYINYEYKPVVATYLSRLAIHQHYDYNIKDSMLVAKVEFSKYKEKLESKDACIDLISTRDIERELMSLRQILVDMFRPKQ